MGGAYGWTSVQPPRPHLREVARSGAWEGWWSGTPLGSSTRQCAMSPAWPTHADVRCSRRGCSGLRDCMTGSWLMNDGLADPSRDRSPLGHSDFDLQRRCGLWKSCPVRGCTATLLTAPYRRQLLPWCPAHGIRLHSNTFVYWAGDAPEQRDYAALRNFPVRPDMAYGLALHN